MWDSTETTTRARDAETPWPTHSRHSLPRSPLEIRRYRLSSEYAGMRLPYLPRLWQFFSSQVKSGSMRCSFAWIAGEYLICVGVRANDTFKWCLCIYIYQDTNLLLMFIMRRTTTFESHNLRMKSSPSWHLLGWHSSWRKETTGRWRGHWPCKRRPSPRASGCGTLSGRVPKKPGFRHCYVRTQVKNNMPI